MVGTDPIQFKDLRHSRVGVTTTTPRPMACTVPVVVVVTGTLQKEAWDLKVLPPVEQVRPGLWSIPVPIPNNPLRYVLVYDLELDGGGGRPSATGWRPPGAACRTCGR
jgi:hypothetical protein